MRRTVGLLFLSCIVSAPAGSATAQTTPAAGAGRARMSTVVVSPAIVEWKAYRNGVGFFVDGNGTVACSRHLLLGTRGAQIFTAAGREYDVTAIIAEDTLRDLVLLQTAAPPGDSAPFDGEAERLAPGDSVFAIGHPRGDRFAELAGTVRDAPDLSHCGLVYRVNLRAEAGYSGAPVLTRDGRLAGALWMYVDPDSTLHCCISPVPVLRAIPRIRPVGIREWNARLARRAAPPDPRRLLDAALRARYTRGPEEAIRLYTEYLAMFPFHAPVMRTIAQCEYDRGAYAAAERGSGDALRLDPRDAGALDVLAHARWKQGDAQGAADAFLGALALRPADTRLRGDLAASYVERMLFDSAAAQYGEIVRVDTADTRAWKRLAFCAAKAGKPDETLRCLLRVLRADPRDAPVWRQAAGLYADRGDDAEALRHYRRAAEIDSLDPRLWYNIGVCLQRQNAHAAASDAYRRSIALDPMGADALLHLCECEALAGRVEEAVSACERAHRVLPSDPRVLRTLADTYMLAKEFEPAAVAYDSVARTPIATLDDFVWGAVAYKSAGRPDDACRMLFDARRVFTAPEDVARIEKQARAVPGCR